MNNTSKCADMAMMALVDIEPQNSPIIQILRKLKNGTLLEFDRKLGQAVTNCKELQSKNQNCYYKNLAYAATTCALEDYPNITVVKGLMVESIAWKTTSHIEDAKERMKARNEVRKTLRRKEF